MVMARVSRAFTSRPSELRTWDISVSPELVGQMAPVRWLWTPTPHKEYAGHCSKEGEMAPHRAACSICCLSDFSPRTR